MIHTYRRLGELLVARSAISNLQLSIALADQRVSNRRLGEIVVERGYTTEYEVAACLAHQYGYSVIDLAEVQPKEGALAKLSAEDALALRALPIEETESGLLCAISDPIDVFSTDKLAALTRSRLQLQVAPEASLIKSIRSAYRLNEEDALPAFPEAESSPERFKSLVSKQRLGGIALFEAFDTVLDRAVSLSATPEGDKIEFLQFQIIRSAAKASNEGVAAIYDSLSHKGYRWTVMQPLSGESLDRILKLRGPRTVPQAAVLVSRVAEIVDTLQRSGGLGHWASPCNLLVQRGGPLLAPICLPPVSYGAPSGEFDPEMPGATAAYALGCLLKDCLYGIDAKGEIGLPVPMKDILANCLASDPEQRYGSAVEVASALRSYNWQALSNPHAHSTTAERDVLLSTLDDLGPFTVLDGEKRPFWTKLFKSKAA